MTTSPQRRPRAARPWPGLPLALLLGILCLPGPAAAHGLRDPASQEVDSRFVALGGTIVGLLSIPADPAGEARPRTIILVGDGAGPDGRLQLYALRLLSLGFAVLEADDDATADGGLAAPEETAPVARLAAALSFLRAEAPVAPARPGVIAIGAGAHGLLARLPEWRGRVGAAALLYPDCRQLLADLAADAPRAGPGGGASLLLVHGDADPVEEAACGALAAALATGGSAAARYVLRGAGFGWDLDGASGRGHSFLPDPGRTGARLRAVPDPQRALIALDRMLLFLWEALGDS